MFRIIVKSLKSPLRWVAAVALLMVWAVSAEAQYIQTHLMMAEIAEKQFHMDKKSHNTSILQIFQAEAIAGKTYFEFLLDGIADADLRAGGLYGIDASCGDPYPEDIEANSIYAYYNKDYDYVYAYTPPDAECNNIQYMNISDWPIGDHSYNPRDGYGTGTYKELINRNWAITKRHSAVGELNWDAFRAKASEDLHNDNSPVIQFLTNLYGPIDTAQTLESHLSRLHDLLHRTNALAMAEEFYTRAENAWEEGRKIDAMYNLGIVIHMVQDMTVPNHVRRGEVIGLNEEDFESGVWTQYLLNGEKPGLINISYTRKTIAQWIIDTATETYDSISTNQVTNNDMATSVRIGVESTFGVIHSFFQSVDHGLIVADFAADKTLVSPGEAVQFFDLSIGDINNWFWSFGNGIYSGSRYPTGTYTDTGTYTVTLTVTGPAGSDTEIKSSYINVSISDLHYSLRYQAGSGGSVEGDTSQTVMQGMDGNAVKAVPVPGFYFTGWNDGRKDNPRRDRNVSGDVNVTANFAPMIRVVLTGEDLEFTIAFNARIVGTAAKETVTVAPGTSLTFFAGDGDRINLPYNLSDYTITSVGNQLFLEDYGGNRAVLAVTGISTVGFADGDALLGMEFPPGAMPYVQLGGAAVGSAPLDHGLVNFSDSTYIPNLEITATGDQQVQLSWDAIDGAMGYFLYYGITSDIHPSHYDSFDDSVALGNVTAHTLTGLNNGATYYFVITADVSGAESDPSNVASATPQAPSAGADITNSIGMTFNYIEPGTFMMGSPEYEPGRYDDETQHEVTLTQGYYMQTTEVTQGQWEEVMGDNPSYFSNCGDDCPVENVSWNDAQDFIDALNTMGEGTYRLPTEAEWEYAARAGSTTAFANGEITETGSGYDPVLDSMGWYWYNSHADHSTLSSGKGTQPVAQKDPNAWGLYDMHGNAWEWVADWYGTYPSSAVTDPTGPTSGSIRVVRGGGWISYARDCRSAFRYDGYPEIWSNGGFRLVLLPGH